MTLVKTSLKNYLRIRIPQIFKIGTVEIAGTILVREYRVAYGTYDASAKPTQLPEPIVRHCKDLEAQIYFN